MHQKLIAILSRQQADEILALRKFVDSPFFNEDAQLGFLLDYYLRYAPSFDQAEFNDQNAFVLLFPNEAFNAPALHKLNSRLFQLTEDFLAHTTLSADEHARQVYLLQYYTARQLSKPFESILSKAAKALETRPHRDEDYYKVQLELAQLRYEFQSLRDSRQGDGYLGEVNEALDLFFVIKKLKQLSWMLARQRVVYITYRLSWMDEVMAMLDEPPYSDIPTVQMYRKAILLLLHPADQQHYENLKNTLEFNARLLSKRELRLFYTYLENAAKHIYNNKAYPEALFELYSRQLESGVLCPDGWILHSLYRNVAGVALHLGHFEWAKHFLKQYAPHVIPESYRSDAYALSLAELHFYSCNWDQALELLSNINPEDIYYKLAQKSLLSRIYFEKREVLLLENFLNTFTKFVFDQQKRIAREKVQSYRLFINFLRKLLKILTSDGKRQHLFEHHLAPRDSVTPKKMVLLKKQMAEAPFFNGKQWLLDQISQYQSGIK